MASFKASLIIPFYKDLEALDLILRALNQQTAQGGFEVIIAEDDDAPDTIAFLASKRPQLQYPLQHVSQPDEGYQRSKALNNGIKAASHELVIFIDGDCIPHRRFVEAYLRRAAEGVLLYGRRVNLGPRISTELRQQQQLQALNFWKLLRSDSTRVAEGMYLPLYPAAFKRKRQPWGCNMGVLKVHLLEVNGFDEDYKAWGPEDLDLSWRLTQTGCQLQSIKYEAIIYHLHHVSKGLPEVVASGQQLFAEKVRLAQIFCNNGLVKK